MSSAMGPTSVIEVTAESSPTFAVVAFESGQVMEVRGGDSREAEEEDEVDLPLMVLPPFEHGSESTPSDVVAGVLSQLALVEGAADSRAVEEVNHRASPLELEPAGEEEVASPHLPEQSAALIEEVGPSSPLCEQIIAQPPELVFQTPPPIVSSPESRVKSTRGFVVKASQASPEVHLNCDTHPFCSDIPNIPQD